MTECEGHHWEITNGRLVCTDCPIVREFQSASDISQGGESSSPLPELEERKPPDPQGGDGKEIVTFL